MADEYIPVRIGLKHSGGFTTIDVEMTPEEASRLAQDFTRTNSNNSLSVQGGHYATKEPTTGKRATLGLRFADVLYIR